MNMALARLLKDFSEPEPAHPAFSAADAFADGVAGGDMALPAPVEPKIDVDLERRRAYDEGYQEAAQALESRHRAALETAEIAHQRELAELRDIFEKNLAGMLAERLQQIAGEIALAVSEETAHVLAPVMNDDIAANSVRALAELIRNGILDGASGTVTVKGPRALYDMLEAALPAEAALLRHVETPDIDLTAELDGTVLVTRISAWAASLKKVLE